MNGPVNVALISGAILSAASGVLHIGIVIGGPKWMRFFGSIERGVVAAEAGSPWPAIAGSILALLWFVAAAYALSGAGVISALPLLKLGLVVIASLYMLRGMAVVPIAKQLPNRRKLVIWSSVLFCIAGTVHWLGIVQVWRGLQ
jgi:hypothetical protein